MVLFSKFKNLALSRERSKSQSRFYRKKKFFDFFMLRRLKSVFQDGKKIFQKNFFFEFFLWILFDFFNIVTFENYLQIIFRLRNSLIEMIVLEFRSLMFFEKLEKTVYKAFVRLKANQNANKLVRSNSIECFQNPVWNRKTNKMVRFQTCFILNLSNLYKRKWQFTIKSNILRRSARLIKALGTAC